MSGTIFFKIAKIGSAPILEIFNIFEIQTITVWSVYHHNVAGE